MLCGNPVTEGESSVMEKRMRFDKSTWCIKCKTQRGNLVIRHAVYCKNCFVQFVTIKFRRRLEPLVNESGQIPKRTAVKATGNLLLGFSGGLGSTVLLDLVSNTYLPSPGVIASNGKGGKGHPRNTRVWTKAYACYVEICNAFPKGTMKDRSTDISKLFEQDENFEFILARIEDAFDPEWWSKVGGRPSMHTACVLPANEDLALLLETLETKGPQGSPMARLGTYLASLPTQTALFASISALIRIILIHTAHYLRCSHLALGTSLTSLSISLITSIAQGGGFNIREEYFEEWKYPNDLPGGDNGTKATLVRIVKPLQDIGMKEFAAWAYWNGLSIVGKEKLPGMNGKQTIGSLTKSFIIGLERDYPSTVSTIVRTCSKVEAKDRAVTRCVLCERPTSGTAQDWKARISVQTPNQKGFPSSTVVFPKTKKYDQMEGLLSSRLCYACHTHLMSRSSRSIVPSSCPVHLPQWANAHLSSSLMSGEHEDGEIWQTTSLDDKMKKITADYLL